MRHDWTLKGLGHHGGVARIGWDAETGMIDGPDAQAVLAIVAAAMQRGTVMGDPYPTVYDVDDPLHDYRDMALVPGQWFVLPTELQDACPTGIDNLPDGAVA